MDRSIYEYIRMRYCCRDNVSLSTYFKGLALRLKIASSRLKHMKSVSFAFRWRPMSPAAFSFIMSSIMILIILCLR